MDKIIKQFKLPSYIKGKSFAEASKLIEKKFEGRNDKTSLDTKKEMITRLQQAQEHVKMQNAVASQPQVEQNQAMFGDLFKIAGAGGGAAAAAEGGGGIMGALGGAGGAMGAANTLLSAGADIFGKSKIDTTGKSRVEVPNAAGSAVSKGLKGAQAGMAFGPIGAGVGALIGAGSSLIGSKKDERAAREANHNNVIMQNADIRESSFAYGGKMTNKYEEGGLPFSGIGNIAEGIRLADRELSSTPITKPESKGMHGDVGSPVARNIFDPAEIDSVTTPGTSTTLQDTGKFLGENYGDIMSYAPVVGELFNKIEKPVTQRGTRIEGRASLPRVDEQRLQNTVNDNNVFEGVKTASAGNLGSLMAGNLAGQAGKAKAKGDAYVSSFQANAAQLDKETNLDRRADEFNATQEERFIERQAQDQGAYATAKDDKRRAILEDIGNIGREESNKKLVKDMFGYEWDGDYFKDKKGKKVTDENILNEILSLVKSKK